MKKRLFSILTCLALCLLLLPLIAQRAEAEEYDHIRYFGIQVQANAEDGSLTITHNFEWEAVQELPYGQELKIGIPNGSIRDVTPLTDNIERLDYDNSYMYVYLKDGYNAGDTFEFSYCWTQEYMYTLGEDGSVNYEYTPGWFDEISIDRMRLSWFNPEGVTAQSVVADYDVGEWEKDDKSLVGTGLPYGAQVTLTAVYTEWPNELLAENSAANLPPEYDSYGGWDDNWDDDWDDSYVDDIAGMVGFIVFVIVIVFVICIVKSDGYSGGFGTHYVYVDGLWYPSGHDGKPKPGSVGTKTKPHLPRSSSSGGFGGGSRGGGFGGGGFGGGGGHCACASSCACACACACAGGGRAGCSAKNLYGAVHLSEELTEELNQ